MVADVVSASIPACCICPTMASRWGSRGRPRTPPAGRPRQGHGIGHGAGQPAAGGIGVVGHGRAQFSVKTLFSGSIRAASAYGYREVTAVPSPSGPLVSERAMNTHALLPWMKKRRCSKGSHFLQRVGVAGGQRQSKLLFQKHIAQPAACSTSGDIHVSTVWVNAQTLAAKVELLQAGGV